MKNKLIVKECESCGAIVKTIADCTCENCGIKCCNKNMKELIPNSFDASSEKHIPTYKIVEDEIYVSLNHPMDKDHYIMWIAKVKDNHEEIIYLDKEQKASCKFKYEKNSTIYAFCNKHKLWKVDVE